MKNLIYDNKSKLSCVTYARNLVMRETGPARNLVVRETGPSTFGRV